MTNKMRRDANAAKHHLFRRKALHDLEGTSDFLEGAHHGRREGEIKGALLPIYPDYLDMYNCGAAVLHGHFRWFWESRLPPLVGECPADYCVILRKFIGAETMLQSPRLTSDGSVSEQVFDTATSGRQCTVLIQVVEPADNAEHRAIGLVSQVVGLRFYNECPQTRINASFEVLPGLIVVDHELTVSTLRKGVNKGDREAGRITLIAAGDQSDHDMIQCASQVVYEVSEHKGKDRIRLLGDAHPVPDIILVIRLADAGKLVRVQAGVPVGLSFDVYHVLLSTLELEPPGVSHDVYSEHGQEEATQTANPKGTRNPRPAAQGVPSHLKKPVKAKPSTSCHSRLPSLPSNTYSVTAVNPR